MINTEFTTAPNIWSQYLRVAAARKPKSADIKYADLAQATVKQMRINRSNLKKYRDICGFNHADTVPATYPLALSLSLQMELVLTDAFPFSIMGLIHIRNDIKQYRPLNVDEKFDLECTLRGPRQASKGIEFEFHARVFVNGEVIWESVSALLKLTKKDLPGAAPRITPPSMSPDFIPDDIRTWHIPPSTARCYAIISGDINPIHLHKYTARLLGFPKSMAHGMWSKARALAALETKLTEKMKGSAIHISAIFKQPIFLPNTVKFAYKVDANLAQFKVTSSDNDKVHMLGTITVI